ncbi:uncharacterized protein CEXT_168541 [Caerostris extrusa]|uniref:Uncharacterized protein n=1 Tax=Caerostris extrusa TaxID=172846 RepID=A0AAV4PEB9_CAEEX|nr:uncharacterized protein CEXT_168541 [Caerostris extrusa]
MAAGQMASEAAPSSGYSIATNISGQRGGFDGCTLPSNMLNPQATSFDYRLERLLEEIENQSVRALRQQRKSTIIRGQKNVVTRDLPLYQRALERHGFQARAALVQEAQDRREEQHRVFRHGQ